MPELWREEGGIYRFHYTEAAAAAVIAADEVYEVGPGANSGFGLYATDLKPEDAEPEEIRTICFGGDAADSAFTGVLVFLGDDPFLPFEEVEGEKRIFRIPAEGLGDVIDIDSILVGVGTRDQGGSWTIEAWP